LQLNSLKHKAKELENEIQLKTEEIERLRERTGKNAQEQLKAELRKSYDVLKHLKRQAGYTTEEYRNLIAELECALGVEDITKAVEMSVAAVMHKK
jgi:hypothetical protein